MCVHRFLCSCPPFSISFFLVFSFLSLSRYHLSFLCRKSLPRLYVFLSFSRRQSRSFSTIAHNLYGNCSPRARAHSKEKVFSLLLLWDSVAVVCHSSVTSSHSLQSVEEGKTYPHVCVEVCSRLEGALLCFTRLGKRVGRISLIR